SCRCFDYSDKGVFVVIKGLKLLLIAIAVMITMGVIAIIFAVLMKTPEVASILAIVMAIGLFVLIATMISTAAAARRRRAAAVLRNLDFTSFYRIYYPPVLALALVTITSLLMVLVMPKFQQIFKDFKTPLPEVTQVTLEFSRAAGPWAAVLLLLILFSLMFSA